MARVENSSVACVLTTLTLVAALALSGCSLSSETANVSVQSGENAPPEVSSTETAAAASSQSGETGNTQERGEEMPTEIIMNANGRSLVVELADNSSAEALVGLLADGDLTLTMEDYAGMEKVGSIGTRLPTNDESMSTSVGDVILYQGDKLVVYYGNNSWSFTRLGRIKDASARELKEVLGSDDVEVTLSLARKRQQTIATKGSTMKKIVQTAGRNVLGEFAPEFARFNDDVLFGENWNNHDIDHKTRCIITVVALMSSGITDSSLAYHLKNAKSAGVTRDEIAAVVTHVAFYAGWPKAWAVFNMAKEIWTEDTKAEEAKAAHAASMLFPVGEPNTAFAQYFIGQSYLAPISTQQVGVFNVTFEPGCRNNWHIHHADKGGGQILICVAGRGWYQEEGKDAVQMLPGDCVNIPAGVKHWHGAAADSWFSHLAIEVPGENGSNEWLEAVSDEQYAKLG